MDAIVATGINLIKLLIGLKLRQVPVYPFPPPPGDQNKISKLRRLSTVIIINRRVTIGSDWPFADSTQTANGFDLV